MIMENIPFQYISILEYISISKKGRLLFECLDCKKRFTRKFDKKLTKKFKHTCNFCNGDIDKFMILLRKGNYPYEYMDDWSRFDEEQLPEKSSFYSNLNMEENQTLIIDMLKKYLINLVLTIEENIMIYMSRVILYY